MKPLCDEYVRLKEKEKKLSEEVSWIKKQLRDRDAVEIINVSVILIALTPNIISSLFSSWALLNIGTSPILALFACACFVLANIYLISYKATERINYISKVLNFNCSKNIKKEMYNDFRFFAGCMSVPFVTTLILFCFGSIIAGLTIATSVALVIYGTAKGCISKEPFKEDFKETVKDFFKFLPKYKKEKLKKQLRDYYKTKKGRKEIYHSIKNSPDAIRYLKNISQETGTRSELILKNDIKKELEKKYSDEIFEFHLNKERNYEMMNN